MNQQNKIRKGFEDILPNIARGDSVKVAQALEISVTSVAQYIAGDRKNPTTGARILAEFKKLIKEREKLINA